MPYDGSKWDEDATEMAPELLKLDQKFAKMVKAKGGKVIEEESEEDRWIRIDAAQKRLGFKLNHTSAPRRKR